MAESPKTQIPLLPPAADVRNEDLFIIRQGVEDKNLTFDLLKDGISAEDIGAISQIVKLNTTTPIQGGGNLKDGLTLTITDATTAQKGVISTSTPAVTQSLTDATVAVTPFSLASLTATESRIGLVERATDGESLTDDTTRYINAKQLNSRVNTRTTEARVLELINQERQKQWPVGSIYTNAAVNTNPATLLGFGVWQQFGQGRVLVGVDTGNSNFNTLGKTGGNQNAVVVMHGHGGRVLAGGNHRHLTPSSAGIGQGSSGPNTVQQSGGQQYTSYGGLHEHGLEISWAGENGANKNLQPYVTVYMWRRTG